MATFYSRGIQNPSSVKSALALFACAAVRAMQDNIAMTTAMVIGDTIQFGKISSSALLLPTSTIGHGGFGSGVTLDVGFDDGGSGYAAKLGNDLAVSSAGTKSGLAAVAVGDLYKPVWELAGFTADPKKELTIVGTIGGANVGTAGNLAYHFAYVI